MKRIIAFSGKLGSGKDTAAKFLVEKGYTPIAFADPLKRFIQEVYGFNDQQLWGPSEYRTQPSIIPYSGVCAQCHQRCELQKSRYWCGRCRRVYPAYLDPRTALVTLGTEWGRTMNESTWTDYLLRKVQESSTEHFVVTDTRFIEEMLSIQSFGTQKGWDVSVIRIRRDEQKNWVENGAFWGFLELVKDWFTKRWQVQEHRSETELDSLPDTDFDYTIRNTGSLDALQQAVELCEASYPEPNTVLDCMRDSVVYTGPQLRSTRIDFTFPRE